MENWATFLLVNVVLALVVSIFGNFATPWVKSTYERSVFSSKKKRIEALIGEYARLKILKGNPVRLGISMLFYLALGFFSLTILVAFVGFLVIYSLDLTELQGRGETIMTINILIAAFSAIRQFMRAASELNNVYSLDEYKEKTIKKLVRLGGNPEDLDKEEG